MVTDEPDARRRLGDQGEGHARRYLEARGLTFVAANWRCPAGELDLVMRDGDEIVFVEVKTRHGPGPLHRRCFAPVGRRLDGVGG